MCEPLIDIGHMVRSTSFPVNEDKVIFNPLNKVVLEPTFYDLVEEVRSNQLVDVRTRKPVSKGLLRL